MNTTARPARWPEVLFVVLGIAGLVGTAAQLSPYLGGSFVEGNVQFWKDSLANAASTFIVVDIFVLGAAVLVWMFAECRRLGIAGGWAWAYFLGSAFIGISFAFPLFLAHRQRQIRTRRPAELAVPGGSGLLGVLIAVGLAATLVGYSLTHRPAGATPAAGDPRSSEAQRAVVPTAEHRRAQEQRATGPTASQGIESVKLLGTVPLGNELPGAADRVLRARELVIASGGVVAVHQHDGRPGMAYVVEGEMTEHRAGQAEPIAHRAGSAAFEWTGVTHWWQNAGTGTARAVVVDIVPAGK